MADRFVAPNNAQPVMPALPVKNPQLALPIELDFRTLTHDSTGHLAADSRRFLLELRQIRAMGHHVELSPRVFCDPTADEAEFWQLMPDERLGQDPMEALPRTLCGLKEVLPQLSGGWEREPVLTFCLRSYREGNQIRVKVVDYFNNGETVFEQSFSAENFSKERHTILSTIEASLIPRVKANQERLDALRPEETQQRSSVYTIDTTPVSAQERSARQALLAHYPDLMVLGVKHGGCLDRARDGFTPKVRMNREAFEQSGCRSISIRGQALSFVLLRTIPRAQAGQEGATGNITASPFQDRFGNTIACSRALDEQRGSVTEALVITPPLALLPVGPNAAGQRSIDIDLTRFGLGTIRGMFKDEPLSPLELPGRPAVYCNMSPIEAARTFRTEIPVVQKAATDAGRYFGNSAQVKKIMIFNAHEQNGYYQPNNPDTITLTDQFLRSPSLDVLNAGTAHEVFHLIDGASGFVLSGGKFGAHFASLQAAGDKFLSQINERHFRGSAVALFNNTYAFGHAEDSAVEFFASFLNSMQHPQWEQRLQSSAPEFQKTYRQTLSVLKQQLAASNTVPENAPVMLDIERKIAFLDNLLTALPAPC